MEYYRCTTLFSCTFFHVICFRLFYSYTFLSDVVILDDEKKCLLCEQKIIYYQYTIQVYFWLAFYMWVSYRGMIENLQVSMNNCLSFYNLICLREVLQIDWKGLIGKRKGNDNHHSPLGSQQKRSEMYIIFHKFYFWEEMGKPDWVYSDLYVDTRNKTSQFL